jgi:RHS repeat protein
MQVTQGSVAVGFTFDGAGRRSTQALPNGVVVTYGYDGASRLASLTYTKGLALIGILNYEYDDAGRRIKMGGSLARSSPSGGARVGGLRLGQSADAVERREPCLRCQRQSH